MGSSFLYNPDGVGRFCHAPTVASQGERLYAAWYAYPEKETENASIIFTRRNGDGPWEAAQSLDLDVASSCGNPVLFTLGTNELWLLFVVLQGDYWNDAVIYASCSNNGGLTWSQPKSIRQPAGVMVRHPPMIQSNGNLLLPAYDERSRQTLLLAAASPTGPWQLFHRFCEKQIQAAPVCLGGTEWQLYFRPCDDPRQVHRAYSHDDGRTWSEPIETRLPCPLSGIAATRMADLILVVHNYTHLHQRRPLSVSWSSDRGLSWREPWHVDEAPFEVSYPALTVENDETVHLVYTYNRRMIKHVAFARSNLEQQT